MQLAHRPRKRKNLNNFALLNTAPVSSLANALTFPTTLYAPP